MAEATPPAAEAPAPGGEAGVIVAQRALLYEEPLPGGEGTRAEGQALWTFVPASGPDDRGAIRAEIAIPDHGVSLVMVIRRNQDASLPASHLVDLQFTLGTQFTGNGISTTPGLILKPTEDARGDPLVGAVAPVADNHFWLALSSVERDVTRNVSLLRERDWIDVPIRYGNRRRAILTFEKGGPGNRVFEQAFAAWTP
ncbi:hypothetical protein A6302_04129 [Methylobrevis pamukkalensis]|uniref:Uncharacterized protein n=1 Tax=Methylobrevis pamukkalensis TaxID=1439726 RepID=A0A1E3GZ49_9HYPH|nr:hypothetical protein A6302_04129 [Methylobrevis pamukkalensis]